MIEMLIAAADASAQLPDPNSYASIGWLLVGLGALLVIVNQGFKMKRNFMGDPPQPPNQVLGQSAQELQRRVDVLERHVDESDRRRKGLYDRIESSAAHTASKIEALRVEVKDDIQGVHERINVLESEQGGLKTATDLTNQRLAQIDSKMDQRFAQLDVKIDRRFRNDG